MVEEGDKGLETLKVWQRAMAFATLVCQQIIPLLPAEEKWAMSAQLRRAVQSIPANIAEGYGRFYYQESIRFCYIARGSLEETFSHLTQAYQLSYFQDGMYRSLAKEVTELRRLLNGYILFLKRSKRGANEPGANLVIRDDPAPFLPEPNAEPTTPET
jgi:four helix bundle protein